MQSLRTGAAAVLLLALLAPGALPAEPPRPSPRTDLYGDPLPPGALARIGTIRLRHNSGMEGEVQFAPDGKTLLSVGSDGIVHRWEVATAREVRRLATPRTGWASSFSPDGSMLVSTVSDLQPDLAVWDLKTERELVRCRLPVDDTIWSVALSPDGKAVAATTFGTRIFVWDLPSGRLRWERKADSQVPYVICTSGGAVVTRTDTGVVSVWDAVTGKELRRLPGWPYASHGGLAVSPDGMVLAVAEQTGIALYAADSGADLRRLTGVPAFGAPMQFSRDSRLLLATGAQGVELWEVASGRLVQRLPYPHFGTSLDLSPDGKLVALASGSAVRLYDLATGRELHHKDAPRGDVPFLSFTPDGSALATVGQMAEGPFGLWDPTTGRRLQVWKCAGHNAAFRFAPDGKAVFVLESGSAIRLQDLRTGQELRRFVPGGPGQGDGYQIQAVEPSPDGKKLTAPVLSTHRSTGRTMPCLRVTWDVATAREVSRILFTVPFERYALGPGARLLAERAFRPAPAIRLIEVETGNELGRLESGTPIAWPLVFSPDGTLLAANCLQRRPGPGHRWKESVAVWEVATGLLLFRLEGGAISPTFSADGHFLATGPLPPVPMQLWDLANGMEVGRWYGHSAPVSAFAFAPDNSRLATGLTDGTALIWDLAPALRRVREQAPTVGPADLDRLWADLAGTDARKAQAAIWALVAAPDLALELFGRRLRPVPVNRAHIPKLIAQLDSPRYAEREAATRQLEALGLDAVPLLRKVLDGRPTLELRRRVEALLAIAHTVRPPRTAEERRRVRAVRILEQLRSPKARRLLDELAAGPGGVEETWQAKAALERLAARLRRQAAGRS